MLWIQWLRFPVYVAAALFIAWLVHGLVFAAADRFGATAESAWWSPLRHSRGPTRWLALAVALLLVLPALRLPAAAASALAHGLDLALIGCLAWWLVSLVGVLDDLLARRYDVRVADNLTARRVHTQVNLLRRVFAVAVAVVAAGIMLMTFPAIREIGTGLFASAGVAGLIVGMAARPTLSSLIAGVQVALTEPIRLEDAVVVEGEWGWIEEIGTT